ncbi:MAG: efflux RND transporter periplasmic adaptor subunit [Candidatus Eisenbacteria bacterium]|uniref:Efflux RND transporter periplasmic adaptor subunit n=1 Tax=Eiseniibacteriota bacterium TaxID=2212470 RepID=A0A956M046_UNCEI|nr:efflux RND transporter periplasmic adaptor subunit [Candidatus Eisenbacteria bacterium]
MNRWLRRTLVLAVLVAVVLVLRITAFRSHPVPVTVYEVARGRVEDTIVNSRAGTVESRLHSRMSPGVSGLVAAISARKGEHVKKGDVLLRLDDREVAAQVALAARSLDAYRAAADQACVAADQTERDLRRTESLGQQKLVSEQDLENARSKAEGARADCRAAQERSKQAQASLDSAKAALAKAVITAPFDGVVLDVATEVGEWISPSPPGVSIPPVIDLIDPSSLYVSAPIDEADIGRVRLDLPVRITLDAFRDQEFPGRLSYVASFVEDREEQNRTLEVEAVFTDTALPPNLLPGLSADVEVILDHREEVLRIPSYALLEGNHVLVVVDGKLQRKAVETGLRNWAFTEITGGLATGEKVVVSLDRPEVKAGARAEIQKES